MKTLFLAIAMVVFLADGDVLKKDSLDQERTNIKTKTGGKQRVPEEGYP